MYMDKINKKKICSFFEGEVEETGRNKKQKKLLADISFDSVIRLHIIRKMHVIFARRL